MEDLVPWDWRICCKKNIGKVFLERASRPKIMAANFRNRISMQPINSSLRG
jgi:hypothetical protein